MLLLDTRRLLKILSQKQFGRILKTKTRGVSTESSTLQSKKTIVTTLNSMTNKKPRVKTTTSKTIWALSWKKR